MLEKESELSRREAAVAARESRMARKEAGMTARARSMAAEEPEVTTGEGEVVSGEGEVVSGEEQVASGEEQVVAGETMVARAEDEVAAAETAVSVAETAELVVDKGKKPVRIAAIAAEGVADEPVAKRPRWVTSPPRRPEVNEEEVDELASESGSATDEIDRSATPPPSEAHPTPALVQTGTSVSTVRPSSLLPYANAC